MLSTKSISAFTGRFLTFRLPPSFTTLQLRTYKVPHEVAFDQTKTDNDPKGEEDKSAKPQGSDKQESHPQKRSDPQKSPSSSTGIEPEGPGGSEAGKGTRGE